MYACSNILYMGNHNIPETVVIYAKLHERRYNKKTIPKSLHNISIPFLLSNLSLS